MKVKLHNNADSAAEATDSTVKMMGFKTHLKRDAGGKIEFDENGYAELLSDHMDYVKWAAVRQGYVAQVIE